MAYNELELPFRAEAFIDGESVLGLATYIVITFTGTYGTVNTENVHK